MNSAAFILKLKKTFSSVHFLVVMGLLLFCCLPLTFSAGFPVLFWIKQIGVYLLWVSIFYLTFLFLVPKLLYRNRGGLFAGSVFIILIAVLFYNNRFDRYIHFPAQVRRDPHSGDSAAGDLGMLVITMIIIGIAIIVSVSRRVQADRLREKSVENEKISTELSFLKSQINPHFFFNVLHTIYGLTERDPEKAKDSIYTLSHMMRYVLYETKNDVTTLEKELMFIDNYNKLMQLRLPADVQVIFETPMSVGSVEVAPMLFLPFVENAYKHGISTVYPSFIFISVSVAANKLHFEVRNSSFGEKAGDMEESNGIGLANTQRRLNLLYPGRHSLKMDDNKELKEYTVELNLFLS